MTNGSRKVLAKVSERVSIQSILLEQVEDIKKEGIRMGDLALVAKRNHHKANRRAIDRVFVADETKAELVRKIRNTRYWELHRDRVESFSLDGLRQYHRACLESAKHNNQKKEGVVCDGK